MVNHKESQWLLKNQQVYFSRSVDISNKLQSTLKIPTNSKETTECRRIPRLKNHISLRELANLNWNISDVNIECLLIFYAIDSGLRAAIGRRAQEKPGEGRAQERS